MDSPIWVLADDRPGNVSQALGVAEALGLPFTVKTIRYNAWGRLHNALRLASRRGLLHWSRKAIEAPPPPALVVAAGRRTAPLALWLKRRYGSRLVQMMDPGWPGRERFDLIAVPAHDGLPDAPNLIRTLGACHRATPELLAMEAARWKDRLPDLPRPWTLVAVGGSTASHRFTAADAIALVETCRALPGSILAVTSRRTGAEAEEALSGLTWLHRWKTGEDSPYLALLALADQVVVTGDSMSMCCEACANGGPVFIFAPDHLTEPKHASLHQALYEKGYARPLGGDATAWRHAPLNASQVVAEEIRKRGLV
ncbi:MAG TPA: mitochondrial fission ELM1 family protein [Magnetospirillaceae bacterium]|nr:mitochondrial fission ELM1 family protein [Magnetospirillaceae bacterium]